LIWFGYTSLAYPSGEEGVISSFKLFLPVFATYTCRGRGERVGIGTLWAELLRYELAEYLILYILNIFN
jgi:hypothetical protein